VLGFWLNTERQAAAAQALDESIGAAQNRIIMAGVDLSETPPCRVVSGEKCSGEAQSALAVGAGVPVHVGH
jgi:hypothetical protein